MTPPSVVGIGQVPIFDISANYFYIKNIDNLALMQEIVADSSTPIQRYSNDKSVCGEMFEDVLFDYGPETQKLLVAINAIADTFGCELHGRAWAQVHHKYESCNVHDHISSDLVKGFVYYVSVPEGAGNLYFELAGFGSSIIQPIECMCVVFPSSLKHGVSKNLSDKLRVSVSGNFAKKRSL